MKTQFFFLAVLAAQIFSFQVQAKLVDSVEAKNVASVFFYENCINNGWHIPKNSEINLIFTQTRDGLPTFRIYEIEGHPGFVIISAEDRTYPVLGYSFENNFDISVEMPPALTEWIEAVDNQIKEIRENEVSVNYRIAEAWESYTFGGQLQPKSSKNVTPLLSTTWDQGCGYNQYCPVDASGPCGYTYAGCVATAMGQIMKYHSFPVNGVGSNSYSSSYGTLSADFAATTYNWSAMPSPHGMYNADVQQLLYHCGVSVWMNYGPTGSGIFSTNTARSALVDNFNYSENSIWSVKASYSEENWVKLLTKELDAGRPLLYSGQSASSGKHAFVLDGYQGTDYFHVNWGWSGYYNGYFYLNALNPSTANFTDNQAAIIGIEPSTSFAGLDCSGAIPLTCATNYNGTTVGANSIVNKYTGSAYNATGPEVVHSITTFSSGTITVSLSSSADLAVFLLSDCNIDSLKAYGNSSLSYNSVPGTYYVVVDGLYNEEGSYSLTVNCPTGDADLMISSASVEPYYIESLQSGVAMNCIVENIGNSDASASKLKYYLSVDNLLDGSDIYIDEASVPAIAANEMAIVEKSVNMPSGLTSGAYNVIFVADANNEVVESDETLNNFLAYAEVPAAGSMDCSSAVNLVSGVRYFGNTQINGSSNINNYSCAWSSLDGKEVIHSISATYSGVATIEFSEKITDNINLLVLSSCNENACLDMQTIWNPADTITQFTLPVAAGAEYFFITDAEIGVEGAYSLLINMPEQCPNPAVSVLGEINRCEGSGPVHLMAESGHLFYTWYKNSVEVSSGSSNMLMVESSGEYWVEVNHNDCNGDSEHITVTYSPTPDGNTIAASGNTTVCEGNNVELSVIASTGYTIDWLLNGVEIPGASGYNYLAFQPGVYSAIITNVSCSNSSNEIAVATMPIPIVDLGSDISLCEGTTTNLNAGNGFTSYNWSSGESTQIIQVGISGTYQVTVTDSNGCEGVDDIEVVVNQNPVVGLGSDQNLCQGNTVILDAGTDAIDYLWSTTETSQTIEVTNSNTYSVTATNASGCQTTDIISVEFFTNPTIDLGSDISICEGLTYSLDAGNGFASYNWSSGESSQIVNVGTAGTYQVTVTDENGCEGIDNVEITVNQIPVISLGADTTVCETSITLDAGSGFDAFLWSNGSTNNTLTVDTAGIGYGTTLVFVTVTNNNCSNTDSIYITFDPCTYSNDANSENICKLYPNPTNGKAIIEYFTKNMENVNLVVNDSEGRKVLEFSEKTTGKYVGEINLDNFPKGLYFITIVFENYIIHKKIIKI